MDTRTSATALACLILCGAASSVALAESVPEERRITHREQSLRRYNPFAAEELWRRIAIPPAPALSVEEALAAFETAPGFRVECVAAEPLVVDPVCFEFDADGRIWAAEFRGWMRDVDGAGEADPSGRVVVIEDTNGDTIMDKSTVFLDGLVMPRTIAFVAGGVLVGEPPHLWYCRDTDGDLKCDEKTRVGDWGEPGNPEHTINGLMHAIDNWMYNVKADVRHRFVDGKLIEEKTIFRGQWGMGQDDYGRLFYGYESSSLHGDLFPAEYVLRNPHVGGRTSYGMNFRVAANAQEVFPIRVTPGITLGGTELRDDGRLRTFTIVAGQTIYRGDQFPEEFYGHAVIPEAAGNLVRLDRFRGDGVELETENAFGEVELLASRDERFRPVCSRVGPDGAVYVGDLYRGIIEHVIFMMPYLKNQILSRGLDKPIGLGRIYRISHVDRPLGEVPRMSGQGAAELVGHLSHPNGWWRDTAQRLLVERKAVEVAGALRETAAGGDVSLGRLHALWTLEGIGELDWETVSRAIEDENAMVRATAIRLSERFVDGEDREEVWARLAEVFDDARPMVRMQVLLTLGEWRGDRAEAEMARILVAHPSRVFGTAAVSGLGGRELEFAARLAGDEAWSGEVDRGTGVLQALATGVANEGKGERVAKLLEIAEGAAEDKAWRTAAILNGVLGSGRSTSRWPVPFELAEEPALLARLLGSTREEWVKSASRLRRILTWRGDTHPHPTKPVPKPLSEEEEKRRIAGEAVYTATCFACHKANGFGLSGQAPPLADSDWVNGPADRLVKIALHGVHGPIKVNGHEWNHHMPGMGNSPILNDERLAALLTYIRRAWDNYGDAVDAEFVASVRAETTGRAMPWSVEELLNPGAVAKGEALADPLEVYREALDGGDAERGRELFHSNVSVRCNACHTVGRLGGGFIGPDLSEIGARATKEYLLESLILPNAIVVEGYETMVVKTAGGEFHAGTLVRDDGEEVVLAMLAGGEVTVPASEIEERIASATSTMPPVGTVFSVEEIADLVAYLGMLKPVVKPGGGANRLTYLDGDDPYYVSHLFPKLTTPMWVGEPGVETAVVLSIDDMRDPGHNNNSARYEAFLRPVLERLKEIDGRAPVSIFTCTAAPEDPVLRGFLEEGLSIEVHTTKHPCPLLRNGDLEWSKATVHECIDMLAAVPGTRAVCYRAPCCDVFNTQSPLIFSEILGKPTAAGGFLSMDSSVHNVFTRADPEMPVELALDEEGRSRFVKYTTGAVPMAGRLNYKYMNFVENYPYPYVIGGQCWEIPCHVPGDHQEFFFEKLYGRRLLEDWVAGVDAAAVKKGIMTLVFHPYGKCSPEELIALIDHAVETYGEKVKFLNIGEVEERLTKHLLGGHSLRAADGGDNGVRIMDVNGDGFVDVIVANEKARMTRLWVPEEGAWRESAFPVVLAGAGARFGVMDESGGVTVWVRNEETAGAWSFDGEGWVARPELLEGLEIDGEAVFLVEGGRDRGVRLRDLDGDGRCELLVCNEARRAVFSWSEGEGRWESAAYALPEGTAIVDAEGRDAGLRFADVDGDGFEDVIFSNALGYSVHAWVSADEGWGRETVAGDAGEDALLPPIVREGMSNGAVIHSGRMWFMNENTDKLPSHSIRVDLSRLGDSTGAGE